MSALHAHFHRRDQQAFQRVVDTAIRALSLQQDKPGTSKSPRRPSPLSTLSTAPLDVNARDTLGRTVLHLACSSTHASAPTYVRLLLSHPQVHVNALDAESHWTPLHRAMYAGNLACALLLLTRHDIDVSIKDSEGYTAFDVYNSSVADTKPQDGLDAELFVWGSNRNAGLGLNNADDRAFPELVHLGHPLKTPAHPVEERFRVIRVRDVGLARFHTAVVTTESRGNIRVCGFGSNSRLGSGVYTTTYTLTPLAGLPTTTSGSTYNSPPISRTPTASPSTHKDAITSAALRSTQTKLRTDIRTDSSRVVSVALGQDHSLALTASGEVYSWGSNKHSVLGYVVEPSQPEDPFVTDQPKLPQLDDTLTQAIPRKVQGQLKGRRVVGVAACQTASACWTDNGEVLTWGLNSGQLGYGTAPSIVQVLPRVVSKINQPVRQVVITDTALVCLVETQDVLCLYGDSHFRVTFPAQAFPSAIAPYRPPQANRNASISKVVGIDIAASASASGSASSMFAAVSGNGELFTWTLSAADGPNDREKERSKREMVRPQRVWALRKKFSAVKDVALGPEGSILVCTESGHVFLRSRLSSGATTTPSTAPTQANQGSSSQAAKAFKFQRVPLLQRVVRVHANSAGAYAALRVDARVDIVPVGGRVIREEMCDVVPWWGEKKVIRGAQAAEHIEVDTKPQCHAEEAAKHWNDPDDDIHDPTIVEEQLLLGRLLSLLEKYAATRKDGVTGPIPLSDTAPRSHGADLTVHVLAASEPRIPAHRAVLGARSKVLREVLAGRRTVDAKAGSNTIKFGLAKKSQTPTITSVHPAPWAHPTRLTVSGAHPLTILILLQYLYTDSLLAIWDWRVIAPSDIKAGLEKTKSKPGQIKAELQAIASALELREMEQALEGAFKREVKETVKRDFVQVFDEVCARQMPARAEDKAKVALKPDVVLLLEDREVPCHSVFLRARSPLFKAFFDEDAWTCNRWTEEGSIRVDFTHLGWRAMQYVVMYLYGGDQEMFDVLEFVNSVDELIEFMFSVMSAANELLLDRLVLICSSVIKQYVTLSNACSILADATFFNATALVRTVQGYMARNLETLLESHMLDDLAPDLVKQLAAYIREEQARKAPLARSTVLVDSAMEKHHEWLENEDFPAAIVRTNGPRPPPIRQRSTVFALEPSPSTRPKADIDDDGIFAMDGVDPIPPLNLGQQASRPSAPVDPMTAPDIVTQKTAVGWKVSAALPKTDMKAIMAEAQTSRTIPTASGSRTPVTVPSTPRVIASDVSNWRTPQRKPVDLPERSPRPATGSPWKTVEQPIVLMTPPVTPQKTKEKTRDESKPGMGPVITPVRLPPTKSGPSTGGVRRVSSGTAAWSIPPPQPAPPPVSTPPTSGMSFIAIQQLQLEQEATGAPKKDKRSLKEIQEEEHAKQVEDDFLKWWAAEEERMREEEAVAVREAQAAGGRDKRKGKKAAGKERAREGDGPEETKGGRTGPAKAEKAQERGQRRQEGRQEKAVDVVKDGESSTHPAPRRRRRPPQAQTGISKPLTAGASAPS